MRQCYNENFNLFKTLFYKNANNIAIILFFFNFIRVNKLKKFYIISCNNYFIYNIKFKIQENRKLLKISQSLIEYHIIFKSIIQIF